MGNKIIQLINNSIQLNKPFEYEGPTEKYKGMTMKAILICMLFAPVTSVEQVMYYIDDMKLSHVKRLFLRLEEKSMVEQRTLDMKDSRTRKVYVLTKKGYNEVVDYVFNAPVFYNIKKKTFLKHYYALSNVFFSFLIRGNVCYGFHLEKPIGIHRYNRVQKEDLFADAVCYFRYDALFIEQDMGTESVPVIIDKFERYYKFDDSLLTKDKKSSIVFLYKEPNDALSSSPLFSSKNWNEIKAMLLADLFMFNTDWLADHLKNNRKTLTDRKCLDTIYEYKKICNRSLIAEEIDTTSYDEYRCDKYYEMFNDRQYKFFITRSRSILKAYYKNYMSYYAHKTGYLYESFEYFLAYRECYMWTSVEFKSFLDFYFNKNDICKNVIANYHSRFEEYINEYGVKGRLALKKIEKNDNPSGYVPILYNTYRKVVKEYEQQSYISDKKVPYYICVEFPTVEIGSFLRILHFRTVIKAENCHNIAIYMGVNNEEEAKWITELLKLEEIKDFGNVYYVSARLSFLFFDISEKRLYTFTCRINSKTNKPCYEKKYIEGKQLV